MLRRGFRGLNRKICFCLHVSVAAFLPNYSNILHFTTQTAEARNKQYETINHSIDDQLILNHFVKQHTDRSQSSFLLSVLVFAQLFTFSALFRSLNLNQVKERKEPRICSTGQQNQKRSGRPVSPEGVEQTQGSLQHKYQEGSSNKVIQVKTLSNHR